MPLFLAKKAFRDLMSICGVATERPRVAPVTFAVADGGPEKNPDETKAEAKARRKAYKRRKAAKAARKRTRK